MKGAPPSEVLLGGMFVFLILGITSGFAALKGVLLAGGVFHELCPDSTQCSLQVLRVNLMYQMAMAGCNLPGVLGGYLLDQMGAAKIGAGSAGIWMTGVIGVAFSGPSFQMYIPSMFLMGVGSSVFYMCVMRLQIVYPAYLEFITSALTVMWDLSAALPLVFQAAFYRAHMSLHDIFLLFGSSVGPLAIWFALSLLPRQRIRETGFERQVSPDSSAGLVLCSSPVLALTLALIFNTFQGYFYFSTFHEQVYSVSKRMDPGMGEFLIQAFFIMLPLQGVLNQPLLEGMLVKVPSQRKQQLIQSALNLAWGLLLTVPHFSAQLVGFVIFIFWRMNVWVTFYATIGICFHRHFGKVAGFAQSFAGLVLLVGLQPMNSFVETYLAGDYRTVNVYLTLASCASSLVCGYAIGRMPSSSQDGTIEETCALLDERAGVKREVV